MPPAASNKPESTWSGLRCRLVCASLWDTCCIRKRVCYRSRSTGVCEYGDRFENVVEMLRGRCEGKRCLQRFCVCKCGGERKCCETRGEECEMMGVQRKGLGCGHIVLRIAFELGAGEECGDG